ncbi:hypothetical protein AB0A74_01145 [Saccharothrix sp. NPDC042600]|uniref:DUF7927 domain-containing protein n=1 Tax=Saccharothrix TaxID=2071 RepID=UPI0033C4FBD1
MALGLVLVIPPVATAREIVPFEKTYEQAVWGDFIHVGNSNLRCPVAADGTSDTQTAMDQCATWTTTKTGTGISNNNVTMQWGDVDSDPATYNSSTAQATIPPGATVRYAQLNWGGNAAGSADVTGNECVPRLPVTESPPGGATPRSPVRLTVGGGASIGVTALAADFHGPDPIAPYPYAAFADVTPAFASVPTGTPVDITVADIYVPEGRGCAAGWSIDIVWEYPGIEPTHAPRQKRVYIYNGLIFQDATRTDITITGFKASDPENRIGLTAFDGDVGTGDAFLINDQVQVEPSNSTTDNYFISRTEGSTGPNLMDNLSIDAKTLTTDDIALGSTSATLSFTSAGDGYFPTNLVFSAALGNLIVEKTVDQPVVHEGDTTTFTITVTNSSGTTVNDITVGDEMAPSCNADVGTLLGGESTTYTCTAAAPADDFTNTATVTGTDQFGDALTGTDTVDVDVIHPRLDITKSVNPTTAEEGDPVTYTITVTNTGDVDLTTVQVSDPQLAACDRQFPTLAVAAVETYTCDSTAPAADLTNTATVTGTDPLGLQVTDTASATLDVVHVAFSLTKTVSTTNAAAGEGVTYTVTATNTGDTALQGVMVTDDLTGVLDDATFGSATATTGTATFTTPTLTWTGDLPVSGVATITYTVTVGNPPAGDGNLHNVVTSTTPGAPDAPVTTDTAIAAFSITKTVDRQSAQPGDTVTYTVTVTNTGQTDYTAPNPVTITDDLTGVVDNATFGSATATTGTATYTAPTLTWTGDLTAGSSATITYTATLNTPATGDTTLHNTVTSTTPGGPSEPATTDTTVQTPTPPTALPDTGRPWASLLVACIALLTAGVTALTTARLPWARLL